jgi:hypothetical protein
MTRNFKRSCMIVVAVTAVIVGLTIAVIAAVRRPYPEPHVGAYAHVEALHDARFHGGAEIGTLAVAESYLGVSSTRLRSELRSGKTLAQLAGSTAGKSAAGLLQALIKGRANVLQAALASGRMSKAEVTARTAALSERAKAQLARR